MATSTVEAEMHAAEHISWISMPGSKGFEPSFVQMGRKTRYSTTGEGVPISAKQLTKSGSQLSHGSVETPGMTIETEAPMGITSTLASSTNLVTTMVGAGILGFPATFGKGGWFVSPVILVVCACIVVEIGNILYKSMVIIEARAKTGTKYTFGARPERYDDLMEAAFGCTGRVISLVFVNGFMLLVCGAFLILIGMSLEYLIQKAFFSPYRACVLYVSALFVPLSLLDDMSLISRMAVIGFFASVLYVVAIASSGIQMGASGRISVEVESKIVEKAQEYRNFPTSIMDLGAVISVMIMGFTYQMVTPTVRAEMSHPDELPKAVTGAVTSVALVYGLAGAAGYYGWGNDTSGNVLASMVDGGKPTMAGLCLSAAIIANLCVTFPILMNVVGRAVEGAVVGKYSVPVRMGLLALSLAIGLFVPFFLEFLTLIGSLLAVNVGIFMPLAIYWKLLQHEEREGQTFELVKHVFMALMGAIAMGFGTYGAIVDLVGAMQKGGSEFWGYS